MNPDKVEDLKLIYSYAVGVHADTKRMAAQFPCPELNVAEAHARMTVQALKAKLDTVEKVEYTEFETVENKKFTNDLNRSTQKLLEAGDVSE